jgi:hypothetical protein
MAGEMDSSQTLLALSAFLFIPLPGTRCSDLARPAVRTSRVPIDLHLSSLFLRCRVGADVCPVEPQQGLHAPAKPSRAAAHCRETSDGVAAKPHQRGCAASRYWVTGRQLACISLLVLLILKLRQAAAE